VPKLSVISAWSSCRDEQMKRSVSGMWFRQLFSLHLPSTGSQHLFETSRPKLRQARFADTTEETIDQFSLRHDPSARLVGDNDTRYQHTLGVSPASQALQHLSTRVWRQV